MYNLKVGIRSKANELAILFRKENFIPITGWGEYLKISAWWVTPAIIYVLAVDLLKNFRSVEYLETAMNQGISPELWNIFGVFGLALFGLSMVTVKIPTIHRALAISASKLLLITFEIGLLAFGIMTGKLISAFSEAEFSIWQAWFFGIGFFLLFGIVLSLNTGLWYLARIVFIHDGLSPFMLAVERLSWGVRFVLSFILIALPVVFLLMER